MGGRGSIWGTAIGFLIIGVLDNGLNIMNVSPFYQEIIKEAIIIGGSIRRLICQPQKRGK